MDAKTKINISNMESSLRIKFGVSLTLVSLCLGIGMALIPLGFENSRFLRLILLPFLFQGIVFTGTGYWRL